MFPGGISDKRGNRYEAKWFVRQLFDVIAGKAEWIRFEGVTPPFEGFEFALRKSDATEWHQAKINAPNGNWTINALKREKVLEAFKNRLYSSPVDRCLFVSQDPAKDLRALVQKAEITNNIAEFTEGLSNNQKIKFDQLVEAWGRGDKIAYSWLERCEFWTLPEEELDAIITSFSDLYFTSPGAPTFPELREYAEKRFNKRLTTERVRAEIPDTKLCIKDWSLDPTLRERLREETDGYLRSYAPLDNEGSAIPRRQTLELADKIVKPGGPNVVLITGVAGSGKSGVVRGFIGKLKELGTTHLAFRVDHHLDRGSPQEIGRALTGREESPVSTLKGLDPARSSVLIIDQIDAVSEVSGRNGVVKEAVLRMVNDARNFKSVHLVLVCRTFDLDSDPRLKALKGENNVEEIEVPLFSWIEEVQPFLAEKRIDADSLSSSQKDLLRLPLNLAVFLEVRGEGIAFTSRNDLFKSLLQKKERAIRRDRNATWSLVQALTALAKWMSDRQKLDAPEAVLDGFPGAVDFLKSEGLIIGSKYGVNFLHESFFDYLYTRDFVKGDQSLVDLLTSTQQHLFRRTQTRQILESFRQNDFNRYLRELETVLTSTAVRYHIKSTVTRWLGSLKDPTGKERETILRLKDTHEALKPLIHDTLLSSVWWFDRLHEIGWILNVLNGENNELQKKVLNWMTYIVKIRSIEVVDILGAWWGCDPNRGSQLLGWFRRVFPKKEEHILVSFYKKVIRSRPPGLFEKKHEHQRKLFSGIWVDASSGTDMGIVKVFLNEWFDAHPGRHPFHDDESNDLDMYTFEQIAKKSPTEFIKGTVEIFSRSIDIINQNNSEGKSDSSFKFRTFSGDRFGDDAFLAFLRSAMIYVARKNPDFAREMLSKLDASKHEVLLHLHLETVSANGKPLSGCLLNLLDDNSFTKSALSTIES